MKTLLKKDIDSENDESEEEEEEDENYFYKNIELYILKKLDEIFDKSKDFYVSFSLGYLKSIICDKTPLENFVID